MRVCECVCVRVCVSELARRPAAEIQDSGSLSKVRKLTDGAVQVDVAAVSRDL